MNILLSKTIYILKITVCDESDYLGIILVRMVFTNYLKT